MATEKVLVVEDDEENVALYDAFLNDIFELLIAKNGDDAVRLVRADRPKAVLMDLALDLWMPPTNGFDLTRRIRELPEGRAIPIIAVSACCTEHERQRAVDAGCIDLMSKPIEFDDLIKRLKDIVASSGGPVPAAAALSRGAPGVRPAASPAERGRA